MPRCMRFWLRIIIKMNNSITQKKRLSSSLFFNVYYIIFTSTITGRSHLSCFGAKVLIVLSPSLPPFFSFSLIHLFQIIMRNLGDFFSFLLLSSFFPFPFSFFFPSAFFSFLPERIIRDRSSFSFLFLLFLFFFPF